MNSSVLHEADLYGFSRWLAARFKLPVIPKSLRGIQHGWIWWNTTDFPAWRGYGFDPNLSSFWGELTQDQEICNYLLQKGIYSKPSGMPFSLFWENEKQKFLSAARSGVLFAPSHSNPWVDKSLLIDAQLKKIFESGVEIDAILLGVNDYGKVKVSFTQRGRIQVEKGAGVFDVESFHRLARVFCRYEYMISATMGSHVAYALLAGMKVGVSRILFREAKRLNGDDALPFNEEYLDARFPGLLIDCGLPTYNTKPIFSNMNLGEVVEELGWLYTSQLTALQAYRSTLGSESELLAGC